MAIGITLTGTALDDTLVGTADDDTLQGLDGNDTLQGLAGNDSLDGGAGNDLLDGGTGADTMAGGLGDDTFVVDNVGDVVVENAGEGADTVQSSISYTLGATLEDLTLTGAAAINGTGNAGKNTILGNAADNVIDGAGGADSLRGGAGNDTYIVNNAGVTVVEKAGEGTDTVTSSVSFTLGANVENLTLVGAGAIDGTGNTLANQITGNGANNILDGGSGADTLTGGLGNDTYVVDTLADTVVENAGGGTDTVQADLTYTLGANLENLTLTGTGKIDGTGNALDNVLTGNAGRNVLTGGAGNDTYVVDAGDTVVELANQGVDTVVSSVDWTLDANTENLTLSGGNRINGTGNAGANVIVGNDTANVLDGQGGADSMSGGDGNDSYIVDNAGDVVTEAFNQGRDDVQSSISWTLSANVEDLTLTGANAVNGTGNALDNTITGNAAANVLAGGLGEDLYVVGAGDTVVELAGEGRKDEVSSAIDWTLGANIENLTLTGVANVNGTGNELDNLITGNTGNNTLDGLVGADTLIGGLGDDTYVVDNPADVVTELLDEGIDTVVTGLSYTLGDNVENLTLTGLGAIDGTGNALANVITGNGANNVLDGQGGADTLTGGLGDDTYIVDDTADVVVENPGEGNDTVLASASYTLSANIETLTLTGSAAIDGTGNALDNVITGNDAANVLDGGAGADTLTGGLGDDTYVVDSLADHVTENPGEGTDTVQSSVSWTLDATLENLTLTGAADIDGTGNAAANVITGNGGANTLDGQGGADTLAGGAGDDTYIVDGAAVVVVENAGEGVDTVISSVGGTLVDNVDNLELVGAAVNGIGNALDNQITGNGADNLLDGKAGDDTMTGGLGDDTYVVDSLSDLVVESAGQGTDTVQSSVSWTLDADVENLTLTGVAAIDGTGNAAANVIRGNAGANVLTGGAGDDTYFVTSADTILENSDEGTDTAVATSTFTLGGNVENLVLGGVSNIAGNGNELDNQITGNSGANTLDGKGGNDAMAGGLGNDTYVVDSAGDTVLENSGEGTDTVRSAVSYALGNNVENLTLTGTAAIDGTGNALANVLTGNSGANVLAGGAGDDTYFVTSVDTIVEAVGAGIDTAISTSSYTLGANVENLVLSGVSTINGTGNAQANQITGNAGINTLDGKGGADTMVGGAGNDTYFVDSAGDAVVENSGEGIDAVNSSVSYALGANLENLTLTGAAAINGTGNALDNVIKGNSAANVLAGGLGDDTYTVAAGDTVVEQAGEGTDAVVSAVAWTLAANVENLTLTGTVSVNGTGNALGNVMTGNSGANILDGKAGADMLAGGLGNDTYVVDDAGDVVTENAGAGTDTVQAGVSWTLGANLEKLTLLGAANVDATGNELANTITGNSGNNVLDGRAGNDTMSGGLGNDTYVVDSAGDIAVEGAGAGTDTVISSVGGILAANVENLVLAGGALNGTGNALANQITGNDAANVLDGKAGNDTLTGGLGNDTYIVDSAGDVVVENAGEGHDTVQSSVSWTLGASFEDLTLTGASAINGTGNAGDNVIRGNGAANVLTGGAGNDTYFVTSVDTIVENAGAGIDTAVATTTYTLGANVDSLVLAGAALNGTGNALDNLVTGNASANTLDGKAGNDILQGLGGNDVLRDLAGNSALDGGSGDDTLQTGGGNAFLAGGTGNDLIQAGSGNAQIIGFNAGDGLDTVVASGAANDTLSLGKVQFADLHFSHTGNDLTVSTALGEGVVLQNWYAGQATVATLQMVIDGTADYTPAGDAVHSHKVVQFDFANLVAQFDAQATNDWAVEPSLAGALVNGSDTAALGGDVAVSYAHDGSLAAATAPMLTVVGSPDFGVIDQNLAV